MTEKMRDDAIREAARNAAVDEYFKARPQLMRTRHEECLVEAGFDRAWQAAQDEQSVPVVGEHIRSIKIPTDTMEQEFQHHYRRGYEAGKASNNAELERLRKDAERGRLLINRGEWLRFDHDTPDAHALLAVRLPYNVDLSCKPTREDAIDAAIAAEGEK